MIFIKKKVIKSWAKEYHGDYVLYLPKNIDEIKSIISNTKEIIPSGGNRSYGDSAISNNIINSKNFNKIISFDENNGVLKAGSGITINEILNYLVPKGWFLNVTPGTKFATLGGCVASDVHGKEHHKFGCFSENLISFKIILNENDILEVNQNNYPDLYKATCGGMGLTGFIIEVELKCKKIKSSIIDYNKKLNYSLNEVFSCFEKYNSSNYSVAWLNTSINSKDYKSIFIYGNFSNSGDFEIKKKKNVRLPFKMKLINNFTIKLFNFFYFFWNSLNKKFGRTDFDSFFYPLDKIKDWYKLYGKNGFIQYQFVIPKEKAKFGIKQVLDFLNSKGCISSLAVLKLHGKNNENYLSFPTEGYSLAMDFPINDKIMFLLNHVDEIVDKFDGKVYLTKDSRLSKKYFEKFYPKQVEIRKVKKKYKVSNFLSNQSSRIGMNDK